MDGYCDRCGASGPGRERWMFHHGQAPRMEFFCPRCDRILRAYGAIGLSLLMLILIAAVVAVWWLRKLG